MNSRSHYLRDFEGLAAAIYANLQFIARLFTQQALAQRRAGGNDRDSVRFVLNLQTSGVRPQKQMLFNAKLIFQRDQVAGLNTFVLTERREYQLLVEHQRLANFFHTTRLTRSQIRGFEPQRVVFVFGDIFFVGRGFIRGLSSTPGDIQSTSSLSMISCNTSCLFMVYPQNWMTLARLFSLGAVRSCCIQKLHFGPLKFFCCCS